VFDKLKKESKGFSQDSVYLEQQIARILKEQESHGFLFDDRKAEILLADLRERMGNIEKLVHEVFKPKLVDIKEVIPKLKQDGTLSKQGLTEEEYKKKKKKYDELKEEEKEKNPFHARAIDGFGD